MAWAALETARQLGWTEITACVLLDGDTTPDLVDLTEIAENLHRRDIGETEQAELMATWREITKARVRPKIKGGNLSPFPTLEGATKDLGVETQVALLETVPLAPWCYLAA